MRLTLVSNPRSGRGKASCLSRGIAEIAGSRGHNIQSILIEPGTTIDDAQLEACDRLIIVGGDGTVHHLLPHLARTQTPFHHCGTGTANLIAHAFRMSNSPRRVVEQVESECEPTRVDLPLCNGHPFLIMTSLGLDASVIHRLEESRTLGGFRAYIKPVLAEIANPRMAHVQVTADGEPYDTKPGVLIVANFPNYGGHFDPCRHARADDATLDIANIPGSTSLSVGLRYLALLARLPVARTTRAQRVRVEAIHDSHIQIDGEKPRVIPSLLKPTQTLDFRMSDQSIFAHAPRLNHNPG